MDETTKAGNDATLNNDSHVASETSSEMVKPYLKTLGRKYYKNEFFRDYESLGDAMDELLSRPAAKKLPDEYGLREGADELYRKAGLTKEEAAEIDAFYGKMIPDRKPELAEVFGDELDAVKANYTKGIEVFSKDLAKEIEKSGLDKDPLFVRIIARVGKETGTRSFVPPASGPGEESAAIRFLKKNIRG